MFNLIDSEEKIVLAKMARLLTKYSKRIISENGDGKNLLECSGLSCFVDDYQRYLNPHRYDGSWKNLNDNFNPGFVINEICSEISSNQKSLGMFLNEFISRIIEIDEEDIDSFKNYLEILGYNLEIKEINDSYRDHYEYSLSAYTEGMLDRREDISYLANMLNRHNSELVTYYTEAISTYGNTEYQGCIGNCRTLLEKFFSKFDDISNDCSKGILNITKESVTGSEIPRLSTKGIFGYWNEKRNGFNRYRLFYTLYSLMSGLGPHGEEVPTKHDALLCLRVTEDILIWCFQNNNF